MFDLESDLFLLREEAFIYKYLLSSYYVPVAILKIVPGKPQERGHLNCALKDEYEYEYVAGT